MKEMPPYKKEPSTNHSSISPISTPTASRDKYVSPFPLRCPSPLQARLASSPLHIPLGIALKRLSSGGSTSSQGGSSAIQNIKNILQQFAESLYLTLQRQLYGKFNVEMKRIILRYRDVERLIDRLQQKINTHADVLHAEEVFRTQQKRQQETIRGLEQKIKEMGGELARADKQVAALLAERGKLESENQRLSAVAQKLETILLRKLQNHEQRNKQNERGNNNIGERRQTHESKMSLPIRPHPYPDPSDSLSMQLSSPSSTCLTNINQLPPSQSPIRTQTHTRLKRPPRPSHETSAVHLHSIHYY